MHFSLPLPIFLISLPHSLSHPPQQLLSKHPLRPVPIVYAKPVISLQVDSPFPPGQGHQFSERTETEVSFGLFLCGAMASESESAEGHGLGRGGGVGKRIGGGCVGVLLV